MSARPENSSKVDGTQKSPAGQSEVFAILGGLVLAVATYFLWSVANEMAMGSLVGNVTVTYASCSEHIFGVYSTSATRAYAVGLAVFTVFACAGAIYASVRLTRARRPGLAVAILIVAFLGLAPASACDALTLYTCP